MSDLNINNNYTDMVHLTPFKMCVLQNFPFIEADFDAVTNYQLLCKVVEYLNNIIDNNNKQNENITQLEQNFITLYNYVKDYFNNLDVQDEINKKLDEMAADGSLSELIQPLFDEYKKTIDSEVNTQNNKITVLQNRMDEFASLPDGSTAGNAELVDIRVPATGFNDNKNYDTAGNAVRGQVSTLNNKLSEITQLSTTTGYYATDGTRHVSNGWTMIDQYIPVSIIDTVNITLWNEIGGVCYYDINLDFISAESGTATGTVITKLRIPYKAVYCRFCYFNNNPSEFTVNSWVKFFLDNCIYTKKEITQLSTTTGYYETDGSRHVSNGWTMIDQYIPVSIIDTVEISLYLGIGGVCYYNNSLEFISAESGTSSTIPKVITTLTIPDNAVYCRFCYFNNTPTLFSVNSWVKYFLEKSYTNINNNPSNIITVGKNNCDYTSIKEAVKNANDSKDNPITILIYPGVYDEVIESRNRYISFVGVNRDTCIIRDTSGKYANSPMWISGGEWLLQNLTFIANGDNAGGWVPTWENFDFPSYAIHIDGGGAGKGNIINCVAYSECLNSIGIGLHNNETITIEDTIIERKTTNINYLSEYYQGALACHSTTDRSTVEENENLIVKNCDIISNTDKAVQLFTYTLGSPWKFTFELNTLEANGKVSDTVYLRRGTEISGGGLGIRSHGNNDNILNHH